MQEGSLLFLGTGGSMGIPVIGCTCSVCRSESLYNKRLRPSVLLKVGEKTILIDAGPDFRTQALTHGITRLDGVMFTHAHHDHTAGLDDLRVYYMWMRRPLPCLASRETAEELTTRYSYIFDASKATHKLVAKVSLQLLEGERGEASFLGLKLRYFTFEQSGMRVNGFRFGNLGFVSDIYRYPETIFEDLQGVETLVISALKFETSHMHFSIPQAGEFALKVGAKNTWLTHIGHEVDHEKDKSRLPPNVRFAYDGLTLNFQC